VRLAKSLAHGGVASRRKAEEIIAKGVVTVGGEVVTDPARDVGDGDDVRVNGAPVGWPLGSRAWTVSTAQSSSSAGTLNVISPLPSVVRVTEPPGVTNELPSGCQNPIGRSVLIRAWLHARGTPLASSTVICTR